jgi:endonuclease III
LEQKDKFSSFSIFEAIHFSTRTHKKLSARLEMDFFSFCQTAIKLAELLLRKSCHNLKTIGFFTQREKNIIFREH